MFFYIAILALFQAPDSGPIWIDNNEVWMQTASDPRQLTSDSIPKRLPTVAPDGRRLVYLVDQPSANLRRTSLSSQRSCSLRSISTVNRCGRLYRKGYVPDRFERLDWLDE